LINIFSFSLGIIQPLLFGSKSYPKICPPFQSPLSALAIVASLFLSEVCSLSNSAKAPYQKDKENYIKVFTETILVDKDQAEREDRDATYALEPLQKGSFSFAGNEKIWSITLSEIKMVMRGITNPTLVIKASDVLKTLKEDLDGLSLSSGDLVHAKFKFLVADGGKLKTIIFEITPPNVTNLTRQKHADLIGDYLKENGVKLV
jgi:hypothetical protein